MITRTRLMCGLIAVAAGLLFGALVLSIAFHENPQGEFFDQQTGALQVVNAAKLFLPAFAVAAILVSICEFGLLLLMKAFRREERE